MIYTLDMLLAELGQELPLGNGERYRQPLKRHIKHVLGKIGYQLTANVYTDSFEVNGGVIDPLPDYVLDVLDAGFTAEKMSAERFGPGYHSQNELAFIPTPFGVSFPNMENGTVFLMVQSLPMDKQQQPYIMEDAYQACHDYAFAKLLLGFPTHPLISMQRTMENDALGMIDQARAKLNRRGSHAKDRVNRKYW